MPSIRLSMPGYSIATLRAVAIFALLPMLPLNALSAEQQNRSVIGAWRLTAVLDSSEIVSMDEKEANQLLGEVLTISPEKVQLGSRVCLPPKFDVTRAETNKYFREEAHASAANLALPNPVTAVHVGCTSVYIKSRDRMVVHWNGFFFDAVRLSKRNGR